MQYRHADGRCMTVPNHPGRDVSPVLLRQIIKDISVTLENLLGRDARDVKDKRDVKDF